MSNVIGIVNYNMSGNIYSIKKALLKIGATVHIVQTKEQLQMVDKIILPGVGSFTEVMRELSELGLLKVLKELVLSKPTLGICIGMQILAKIGFEHGEIAGLGVIDAEVKRIKVDAKIPHLGFGNINVIKPDKLMEGVEGDKFYFMHSYELISPDYISSTATYASHTFIASIQKGNLYGVQFHPEKSRDAGLKLFENFLKI